MSRAYSLEPLSREECDRWDELTEPFSTRELFHRQAWLDYLSASRGIEIRKWAIRDSGQLRGYLCAGVVRKGPFRILASPLKGWGTNSMGPVTAPQFDHAAFLASLETLAKKERFAMVELENCSLCVEAFEDAQYRQVAGWTYRVALSDPDDMWNRLTSTCRKSIRKALRSGLTVEDASEPCVADEYYDRYLDLMVRKGLVPPYPRSHPRLLFAHLKSADLLFSIRVLGPDGTLLAVGLFPHDDRTVYFWGGASWQEGRNLCPNDLLHWDGMRMAAQRGLTLYDMCGYGQFKKKFGGSLETTRRWHKSYVPGAELARQAYSFWFQTQSRARGCFGRLVHQRPAGWAQQ